MYSGEWVRNVGRSVVGRRLSKGSGRRVRLSETVSRKLSRAIVDGLWVSVGLVHFFAVAEKEG